MQLLKIRILKIITEYKVKKIHMFSFVRNLAQSTCCLVILSMPLVNNMKAVYTYYFH